MIRVIVLLFCLASTATSAGNTYEHTLENGLKVVVREDPRAPVFVAQIWYRVGSTYEPQGLTGISHVVEHMMFKGSAKQAPGEFARTISRFGGQNNAFTSADFTAYYALMSNIYLPLALELEADRMQTLLFDKDEFTKEMNVIMEERRLRTDDNPYAQFFERFNRVAHINSYGQPVIGWMSDLQQITRDDAQRWYEQWYAPNNATLVVVGDVKADTTFDLAERFFGDIKPKPLLHPKKLFSFDNVGARRLNVTLKANVPSILIGFNVPVVRTASESWEPYALTMLANVLDGSSSARFSSDLVRGRQIATAAGAGYDPFTRGDQLFVLSATPNTERDVTLSQIESALWNEINKIKKTPPTKKELERIKAQVISGLVFTRDSIEEQANMMGSLESVGLSWKLIDQQLALLSSITPEQIQTVARKYLTENRATTATLQPDKGGQTTHTTMHYTSEVLH